MLWPRAGRRHVANTQLEQRLAEVREQNPESERWLALVAAALAESEAGAAWDATVPTPAAGRPVRAPILHQARITVDRRAVRRWVRRLVDLAAIDHGRLSTRQLDPVALLEGAICQDDTRIDAIAHGVGAEGPALRVVAQMAALPLLQACGRAWGRDVTASWWEGYCPLCGAWPTLAEFRGLERKRWLRCGRCGSAWEVPWLKCPFCDESHHANLGYLAADEAETSRKVEVCDSCKGYVKAEPTVRTLAPWEVLLDDLATVPLEVAALDRGYHRPERPGYALAVQVVARRSSFWAV
jgi:FdhE protein